MGRLLDFQETSRTLKGGAQIVKLQRQKERGKIIALLLLISLGLPQK